MFFLIYSHSHIPSVSMRDSAQRFRPMFSPNDEAQPCVGSYQVWYFEECGGYFEEGGVVL